MAGVIWSRDALIDLRAIGDYTTQFDRRAAVKLSRRLRDAAEGLCMFPNRGRPAGNGTREWVLVRPYVIRYDVVGDTVHILKIRHSAQLSESDPS